GSADGAAVAGERLPRHGLARPRRQQAQHLTLPIREPDDLLAAPQLPAREMEAEIAELHGLDRQGGRPGAPQDAGDAQRQLARLERLAGRAGGAEPQGPESG